MDITITSLGMEPDKFTSGGAPSATTDVLRKLAGDPFADPPQYGKVSWECFFSDSSLFCSITLTYAIHIHFTFRHMTSLEEANGVMILALPSSALPPLDP